ncbi:hypothetical protein MKW92_051729 [Papaver armeniacum]|nr:hypothetical protein MKW92_051729 [Papaver armeniacum]
MVPELEKPRVTEIYVRMDCNGCVQKIKKALSGINGIYDTHIDFPKQKVTIIGWAEPDKIIKAIKKTKKIATVCSHTEPTESTQPPTEPPPPEAAAAPDATTSPTEPPPAENSPPPEPPKDPPPPENPTPPENTTPETPTPPPPTLENPPQPKDLEQIHVIHHHHPQDNRYGYSSFRNDQQIDHGHWQSYPHELRTNQPMYATHSYNNYTPSPYVPRYYYQSARSPPQPTDYRMEEHYNGEYRNYDTVNSNGNTITSIFSDENPNACTIV